MAWGYRKNNWERVLWGIQSIEGIIYRLFCTQANFLRINIVIWNEHVNLDNLFLDILPNQGQNFKVIET